MSGLTRDDARERSEALQLALKLIAQCEHPEPGVGFPSKDSRVLARALVAEREQTEASLVREETERGRAERVEKALLSVIARCDQSVTGMVHAQTISEAASIGLAGGASEEPATNTAAVPVDVTLTHTSGGRNLDLDVDCNAFPSEEPAA